jgi:endonuclease G, mitochondrial
MSDRTRRALAFLNKVSPAKGGLEAAEAPPDFAHLPLSNKDRLLAQEAYRKAFSGVELSRPEQFAFEAIIIPDRRPAIDIIKGDYATVAHPDWQSLNSEDIKATLRNAFRSIGRVEVAGLPEVPFGGTGFVVGDGLIMTNRHVAELFARGLGENNALIFKEGMSSSIDFARDPEGDLAHELHVRAIRMIHPYWDLALLLVDGLDDNHPALPLWSTPGAYQGSDVAVVGFPAFDYRNAPEVQDRVFNRTYNVKRLLPGKARDLQDFDSFGHKVLALSHDASTLGGASGSAVIDLHGGSIMGLHFAGLYLVSNYAVPAWELAKDMRIVDAGVKFVGTTQPNRETTDRWWQAVRPKGEDVSAPVAPADVRPQPIKIAASRTSGEASTTITIPIEISIRVGAPRPAPPRVAPVAAVGRERVLEADFGVLRRTHFNLDTAVFLAEASQAAYAPDSEIEVFAKSANFDEAKSFNIGNVQGYWCVAPDVALLVFRGTSNPGQWLRDARFFPAAHPWGHVHIGFLTGVRAVEAALLEFDKAAAHARNVWISGHSLGGALALVAAVRLKNNGVAPWLYSYGQPAVGLNDFAIRFSEELPERLWRFVNQSDIVPRVPPGPFFQHTGIVKRIVRPGVLEAVARTDALSTPLVPVLQREALQEFLAKGSVEVAVEAGKSSPSMVDVELPQLDQLEFSRLQMALGAAEPASELPATEGMLPWISDHAISDYIRLLDDLRRSA